MNWKPWTWFWKKPLDELAECVSARWEATRSTLAEIELHLFHTEKRHAQEMDRQRRLLGKVYRKALALQQKTEDNVLDNIQGKQRVSRPSPHQDITPEATIARQLIEEDTEITCPNPRCQKVYTANWTLCTRCGQKTYDGLVEMLRQWL